MRRIAFILTTLLALAACQDDLSVTTPDGTVEGMRDIILQQPATQEIITRADVDRNDRVENVILFAFDSSGNWLNENTVQLGVTEAGTKEVDGEQHQLYKVRAYLPSGTVQLYAVCNYDAGMIQEIKNKITNNGSTSRSTDLQILQAYQVQISTLEEAFKGVYVMEGMTDDIPTEDSGENVTIPLTRLASKQSFTILFNPETEGDEFKLSRIRVCNIPKVSNLMDLPMGTTGTFDDENYIADPKTGAQQLTNWTADAVWVDNGSGANDAAIANNYLDHGTEGTEIAFEKTTQTINDNGEQKECEAYIFSFDLFENRRGGVTGEAIDNELDISDRTEEEKYRVRQLYKREIADPESIMGAAMVEDLHQECFDYASYIVIEGAYKTGGVNYEAKYYVYLGSNNYGDFNVVRNHHYIYTVTIRACDNMDTRVWNNPLGDPSLLLSTTPFDAFYNAREVVLSSPANWVVYVKNPDETPWLQISTSGNYYARPLADPDKLEGQGISADAYAQTRLTGGQGLHYLYIHTDEYVPYISEPTENANFKPRTGIICCERLDGTGIPTEYVITQYPAQLVVINVWDINQAKNVEHRFFTSRFPEEKYLPWGFEHFWNQTLNDLIVGGLYNGLSTSRKEYASALYGDKDSESRAARNTANDLLPLTQQEDLRGKQNAWYWVDTNPDTDGWQYNTLNQNVPTDIALGYALSRNRDRNNSGHIDYEEILWYLPSTQQMEGIYAALHPEDGAASSLYGEYVYELDEEGKPIEDKGKYNTLAIDGNFWTATPSVSDAGGITPGRAYYVDMTQGKRRIGLRDQAFKILVCRDADGWLGPETGSGQGDVNLHPDWTDKDENMPGK